MNTRIVLGMALVALSSGPPQSQDRGGPARSPVAGLIDSQSFLDTQLARVPSPAAQAIDARVRDLLARMTLKEKIGQMTQLEIGMITDGMTMTMEDRPVEVPAVLRTST